MVTDDLLRLENEVLDAMIRVRYSFDDPTGKLDPRLLDRIRKRAELFAAAAEKLEAQRDME